MLLRRLHSAFRGPLVVIVLFLLTLLLITFWGRSARRFLPVRSVYTVDRFQTAYSLWRDQGLHGRIILYFDRHFTIDRAFIESLNLKFADKEHILPDPNSRNYLTLALYHDIFRAVYHVVPENVWQEVREKLSRYPFIAFDGRRFRLTIEGSPVIVTRLSDLPPFSEKVVIFLNDKHRAEYDARALDALLEDTRKSDVVVIAKTAE